jgi:hypothetical protein
MTKTRKDQNASIANAHHRSGQRPKLLGPNVDAKTEAAAPTAPSTKPPSKQLQLAALVVRDEGATLKQMIAATGWLPHTTRAALTGLKKKGFVITSDKVDGVRTYRAVAPE